jgi:hypothetical protein
MGVELLDARTPQELFRHLSAVVFEIAPTWGDDGTAMIVLNGPLMNRSVVETMFGQICEKHGVSGIALRFRERYGEPPRAILEHRPATSEEKRSTPRAARPGRPRVQL